MGQSLHPTVLLPVGALGERAIDRLRAAVDLDQPLVRVLDPTGPDGRNRLEHALTGLLRVGREGARSAEPRLDILAFVDLSEGRARSRLLGITRLVSDLLAEQFARVFPADAPPEQRTAALHIVAACPPLAATPAAVEVTAALTALEQWCDKEARHPVLAKVWLAAAQTSAGVLTEDDVAATVAGFALPCLVGEVRSSDAMRVRLAHPRPGEGRIGFVSVATLDVPVGRVRTYARTRAALDALDALVDRVQRRAGDANLALDQLGPLSAADTFSPFDSGDEAKQLRDLAWRIAGGAELPERLEVGPFDTPEDLRARFPELYSPALVEPESSQVVQGALEAALLKLERAEGVVSATVHGEISRLLTGTLGGVHRLDRLPEIESAMVHLARRLADERTRDVPPEPPSAEEVEQGLPELREATTALPDPATVRAAGAAVGLAVGVLCIGLVLAAMGSGTTAPTGLSATVVTSTAPAAPTATNWSALAPWAAGAILGALSAWAAGRWLGVRAHRQVRAALETRLESLKSTRARGDAAVATRQAEATLRLHRQRARRDVIVALGHGTERLRTVRASLVATRDRLADQLTRLGIRADAQRDDLDVLLEGATRLHGHLVGPEAIRRWLHQGRRWADASTWADRVLELTWPEDGVMHDVPASDPASVLHAASEQVEHLDRRSLFDDETSAREAADQATAFAARVTMALAPGCVPRNAHGDAAMGIRGGELITVGPLVARSALEDALARADVHLGASLWADLGAPRLSFLRTWEGFGSTEVARGCGLAGRPIS